MLRLDVLEQFMDVQMLLAALRVITYAQDHGVELVEIVGVLSLVKEQRVQGQQLLLVFIHQKAAENTHQFEDHRGEDGLVVGGLL